MNEPRVILIHSPLTGPSFWSGVCDALWARERRAYKARLPSVHQVHASYWLTHAAGVAATLPEEGEVVLVAHSGAGPLLPAIGRLARNREAGATVAGYVFVDSDLPRGSRSRLDLFDEPEAAARLRARSADGWLPRWSEEELQPLIPDERRRRAFAAELPDTPLALYEEIITVPEDWPEAPCGYLALSSHYLGAASEARRAGWAYRRIEAHHLLPVSEPERVAAALMELLDELIPA